MASLQEKLKTKSNNYIKIDRLFRKKTGLDINNDYSKRFSLTKSCSVIVPFYKDYLSLRKNLTALVYQDLPSDFKSNKVEIIVVDDGSLVNLKNLVKFIKRFCPITYLKLKKNHGRATARNLGLLYSKNDIIIFLDQDVIVSPDFIGSHLLRHEFINKCMIVGFRQNISSKDLISHMDIKKKIILRRPNYKKDFRYKRFIPEEWRVIHKSIPRQNFDRTRYLLNETNYFKNFSGERIIGVWDLPYMFVSCNASVPRKYVFEAGGFDMKFKGWNHEDTHLGAKLIARGLYVVPNLHATVYHLVKTAFSKRYERKKIEEYRKNVKLYKKLKKEDFVIQKEKEWKKKIKKYFKNKFIRVNL